MANLMRMIVIIVDIAIIIIVVIGRLIEYLYSSMLVPDEIRKCMRNAVFVIDYSVLFWDQHRRICCEVAVTYSWATETVQNCGNFEL